MVWEWHGGRSSTEESHGCATVKQKECQKIYFLTLFCLSTPEWRRTMTACCAHWKFFQTVLQMQETWMDLQQQNTHLLANKPLEFFEQIFPQTQQELHLMTEVVTTSSQALLFPFASSYFHGKKWKATEEILLEIYHWRDIAAATGNHQAVWHYAWWTVHSDNE